MPCSPSGIFVGMLQIDLDALRAEALSAIATGQWTSVTGGQKTGSLQYQMTPQDVLKEIIYAEQQSGARPPRGSRVYQTLNCQYGPRRYRQ